MEKRKLLAEKEIQINSYDIDAMGIVSNIVYVRWFEDLRMEFLNSSYSFKEMIGLGMSPILMHTEIDYYLPLTIFDQPKGQCWLVATGNSSWELEFEIFKDNKVYCKGKQKGCFYDLNKKQSAPIPEPLRIIFEQLD